MYANPMGDTVHFQPLVGSILPKSDHIADFVRQNFGTRPWNRVQPRVV